MKVTMLNGLPVTMLNGMGCNCQQKPLNGPGNDYSGLLVAGALVGLVALANRPLPSKGMSGFAEEVGKDVIGKVAIGATVIGAAYFLVLKPVLTKVGLIESGEDKARNKVGTQYATGIDSPFSPQFYKNKTGAKLLVLAERQRLGKLLYDADGMFNDGEAQVYAALRQLQYHTQLSYLAEYFSKTYQKDLYSYLRSFLDDSEMDVVHGIVNNLK